MSKIVEILVATATSGSAIALVALGINMIFATTRIVNFAQGGIIVAAGYLAYLLTDKNHMGMNVWLALGLVLLVGVILGVITDVFAIAPLGGFSARDNFGWLVMAISMVLLILFWFFVPEGPFQTVMMGVSVLGFAFGLGLEVMRTPAAAKFDPNRNLGWIISTFVLGVTLLPGIISATISADTQKIPDLVPGTITTVGTTPITYAQIMLVAVSVGLMLGIEALLSRTMLGRSFHAVSQDRQTASLMGINTGRVVLISFAMAGFLAAVAALLIAPTQNVKMENSLLLSFGSLIAAVIGGLGSTRGAIVGAYGVAFVQAAFLSVVGGDAGAGLGQFFVLVAMMVILVVKPSGLFGRIVVEKV